MKNLLPEMTFRTRGSTRAASLPALLLLLGVLLFPLAATAQNGTRQRVTLQIKDAPVKTLFAEIRRQTNLNFIYSNDQMDKMPAVTVEARGETVESVLDRVFRNTGYTFKFEGRSVVIVARPPVNTPPVKRVTGTVVDEEGNPLAGVTVTLKGTAKATVADALGQFAIDAPQGAVIAFSHIGMQARDVVYNGEQSLRIVMQQQAEQVEAVVVTGYQQINRERSTGSFVNVTKTDLSKQMGALSISEKFQSLIPGVLTDAGGNLSIRGKSTINANAAPLIVVDGFPIEGSMSTINPNDVESINILQDAAAASIWGVRASNGVIVITTTRGSESARPVITASFTSRIQKMPSISSLNLANASDFLDYQLETLSKGWYNTTNPDANYGYSKAWEVYAAHKAGTFDDARAKAEYDKLRVDNRDAQKDLFYQTGFTQQYDLSINGGSKASRYYVSANYQDANSYIKGNDSKTARFNLKNTFMIRNWFQVDVGAVLNFTDSKSNGISLYDYLQTFPYMPFVDENNNYVYEYSISVSNARNEAMMGQGYYDWRRSLKRDLDNNDNNQQDILSRFQAGFNVRFIKGLTWDSRIHYEMRNYDEDNYYNENLYYNRSTMNLYTVLKDGQAVCGIPRGLMYRKYGYKERNYIIRNQINADFKFGPADRHIIAAILGCDISSYKNNSHVNMLMNWDKNKLTYTPFMSTQPLPTWSGGQTAFTANYPGVGDDENRYASFYFNGSYTFARRYSVSASARIDKSNLFGASVSDRMTPLWSVGAAWNITNEKFFSSRVIDMLKLRITTGKNGNIDRKTSKQLIARASLNAVTGEKYLDIEYPANPDLKWETTRVNNVGVDFSLLDNRLHGSLEYYDKKSYDLLAFAPGDPTFGFQQIYRNTAEMTNRGLNLILGGNIVRTKEWLWEASLHLTYNKNEVTKVYSPSTRPYDFLAGLPGCEVEGKPIDYLYNYRYAGLGETGEPRILDHEGKIHTWDESDLGFVEWLVYSGTVAPPVYGGFNTSVSYKGLTMNLVLSYKLGHVMRMPSTFLGSYQRIYDDIATRWQRPGDEKKTNVPRVFDNPNAKSERNDFYRYSDAVTQSASFLRFNNLNISYTFPDKLFAGYLSNANVFAQLSNMGVWARNSRGLDPDVVSPRQGDLSFKPSMLYTLGLSVSF